jgi:hypothetical protein
MLVQRALTRSVNPRARSPSRRRSAAATHLTLRDIVERVAGIAHGYELDRTLRGFMPAIVAADTA